jgi:hypothetical protein
VRAVRRLRRHRGHVPTPAVDCLVQTFGGTTHVLPQTCALWEHRAEGRDAKGDGVTRTPVGSDVWVKLQADALREREDDGVSSSPDAGLTPPPPALLDLRCQLIRTPTPRLVVDLGSGTGLSTAVWAGWPTLASLPD